jgi:Predicted hydrolases or acyltransferases (alpha/beta hydrolase superfamily)
MHGLFGSSRNWHTIAQRLADHYRVYTVDLRNHGESPWTPTMTFPEMADDLAAFIDHHRLKHPVIIGHSLGGKTAMLFALRNAGLADQLVVIDIAPVRYKHDYRDYVEAMLALDLKQVGRRSEAEAKLADAIDDAPLRKFLVQNLATGPQGLVWKINLEAIRRSMSELLDFPYTADWEFDGRTLFVSGALSDYIRPQHQTQIFALFPQAEFAVIQDAGHRVHVDQPEQFVERLVEFLESAQA